MYRSVWPQFSLNAAYPSTISLSSDETTYGTPPYLPRALPLGGRVDIVEDFRNRLI